MASQLFKLLEASLTIVCILAPGLLVFALWLAIWGKRIVTQEKEYERQYKRISSLIDDNPVTLNRKLYTSLQFIRLKRLPYKNTEKTKVLYNRFLDKYKELKNQPIVEPILK